MESGSTDDSPMTALHESTNITNCSVVSSMRCLVLKCLRSSIEETDSSKNAAV